VRSPWQDSPLYKGVLVETTRKGLLTLQGFLAMWSYVAAKDPEAALAGAMYLGFPEEAPIEQLLVVSKQRKVERRLSVSGRRATFQCLAFTATSVANSSAILEGLISQARHTHGAIPANASAAAAAVGLPEIVVDMDDNRVGNRSEGQGSAGKAANQNQSTHSVTLLVRNIVYEDAVRTLINDARFGQEELIRADVAAFVFDGTKEESFHSAIELLVATATSAGDTVPCVLVCLNEHQMSQELKAEVAGTCASLNLSLPLRYPPGGVTLVGDEVEGAMQRVYQTIIAAALDPENFIPETPSLRAKREYRRMVRRAALVAAGGTVTVLGGYFLYRYFRHGNDGGENMQGTSDKLRSAGSR
jgi:hypothetical protein